MYIYCCLALLPRVGDTPEDDFGKTYPGVQVQAYHVNSCAMEERLNSVNTSFLRLLLVLITYPLKPQCHSPDCSFLQVPYV